MCIWLCVRHDFYSSEYMKDDVFVKLKPEKVQASTVQVWNGVHRTC